MASVVSVFTLVSSLIVPRSIGYFSWATIGDSSSIALSVGNAGASSVNRSSAAWLTCVCVCVCVCVYTSHSEVIPHCHVNSTFSCSVVVM